MKCAKCGTGFSVQLEDSRTMYNWEGEGEDPNAPIPLCPQCAKEHHENWDDMWSNVPGHERMRFSKVKKRYADTFFGEIRQKATGALGIVQEVRKRRLIKVSEEKHLLDPAIKLLREITERKVPDHDLPEVEGYALLLKNVYELRQLLDEGYDRERKLNERIEKLADAEQRIETLEREAYNERCAAKLWKRRCVKATSRSRRIQPHLRPPTAYRAFQATRD